MVQADDFNRSRIATAIVVVITFNLNLAEAPGNVLLPQKATGLPKDSVANISQVLTVDKNILTEKIGNPGGSPFRHSLWSQRKASGRVGLSASTGSVQRLQRVVGFGGRVL